MDKPNVLLITVDTMRADHLGCYGYERNTSPNINQIAEQGVLCEKMICSGIPTHPSYTTLYTGLHPITHGIVGQGGRAELSTDVAVLPELFLKAGYNTCALDNLMRERAWFGRGYEHYIDPSLRRTLRLGVTSEELNSHAIPWMRQHADEPFFMFMHYWEPHAPYTPPEQYRDIFYEGDATDPDNKSMQDWWRHPLGTLAKETWLRTPDGLITDSNYVTSLYDGEIKHVDDGIGELVSTLTELGIEDNTIVVIFADHGESMTEHNIFFEHHGLYDCTVHVPFIMRYPDQLPAGRRLPQLLQTHDIAPTILQAAGLDTPDSMEGDSYWPLFKNEQPMAGRDQAISVECSLQAKWSLRDENYKLILARADDFYGNPPRELYNLVEDPMETTNLADLKPEIADSMTADLEQWIATKLEACGKDRDPLLDGITLNAVMAMGNLQ